MRKRKIAPHIRWMIRKDMTAVLDIESQCFEFPWSEDEFIRCLRQRNCIGMVAEHDKRVVGFMLYDLHKSRLHITNFAVHKDFRRRGVGAAMAQKLIRKLCPKRRTRITVVVREGNLPAHLFWRSLGFRAVEILRGYYDDTTEDAYLFRYELLRVSALEGPRFSMPLTDIKD